MEDKLLKPQENKLKKTQKKMYQKKIITLKHYPSKLCFNKLKELHGKDVVFLLDGKEIR